MVIVILVIVLQLAEATFDYENPKSDEPEYLELKTRLKELTMQIQKISNMETELPEELKEYIHISEEAIDQQIKQAQNTNLILKSEKEKIADESAAVIIRLETSKEQLKKVNDEKTKELSGKNIIDKEMEQAEKNNQENVIQEQHLQALRQEKNCLKNGIDIHKKLEFSFEGVMSRQPILIECLGDGFRAQVYKREKDVKSFTDGSFDSNLSSLLVWLKENDLKKCYPVLLLREKAFSRLDKIQLELFKLDRNLVLGKEPLDDKVKVF